MHSSCSGHGVSCKAHEVHYQDTSTSRLHIVDIVEHYHTDDSVACILDSKGISSPSLGSFNKWQGRFYQHSVIILKRKLLEIGKIDCFGTLLKEECRAHYTGTTEVHFTVHSEMQSAGFKRPRCTLGPHLFKLTAASTRR